MSGLRNGRERKKNFRFSTLESRSKALNADAFKIDGFYTVVREKEHVNDAEEIANISFKNSADKNHQVHY